MLGGDFGGNGASSPPVAATDDNDGDDEDDDSNDNRDGNSDDGASSTPQPSGWSELPELILERIYAVLPLRDRYRASLVCSAWHSAFYSPSIWRTLRFNGRQFMHRRHSMHQGYWSELNPYAVQMFFVRVGSFVRRVIVEPVSEYYNLYEFLSVWSHYMESCRERGDPNPMPALDEFRFAFACEERGAGGSLLVHGTGGKLLQALGRLLRSLAGLRAAALYQLLLDADEAERCAGSGGTVGDLLLGNGLSLRRLELLNYTRGAFPLLAAALFPNLRTLVISPQQLSCDVIAMLPATALADLVVVQDEHTPSRALPAVPAATWQAVQLASPELRVHLLAAGRRREEVHLYDHAPVCSIAYSTPYTRLGDASAHAIAELYGSSLTSYVQGGLPRAHGSRAFADRCDGGAVALARLCPHLHTLIVRERLSTGTAMVVAREAQCLRRFYVRRNAILQRMDWPKPHSWSDDEYDRRRICARDVDRTALEVSRLLGTPWQPLTDRQFKAISVSTLDRISGDGDN